MSDAPWKAFEREVAALLGGKRYWANSGEQLDVVSATTTAQCKLVRRMSLEALTQLAEVSAHEGMLAQKAGVVVIKVRRGRGRRSPALVVMTTDVWRHMTGGPS